VKKVRLLVLVLLISVFSALPASAGAPVESDMDYVTDFGVARCDGFDVRVYSVGHRSASEYFDNEGIIAKILLRDRGTDYLYKAPPASGPLANPDFIAEGDFSINVHLELVSLEPFAFTEAVTGVVWNFVVPGDGVLFHVSGQSKVLVEGENVLLVRRAGHFPDQQGLCAALD
jgi:hypothetical protein